MAANNPYPAPSASSSSSSSSPPSPSSSLFYAILPSAVKTHWPRLSPFRRSANTQRRIQDSSSSCPISPPLERNSRASWSALLQRGFVSDGSVSRSPSPSPTPRYPRSVTRDPPEGPEWKFAAQGLTLLSTSISEAEAAPTLSRQLYIHALIYLLQALPRDLTGSETSCLRTALPPFFSATLTHEPSPAHHHYHHHHHVPTSPPPPRPPVPDQRTPSPPSLLHRVLASAIVQLFLLVQLLAPYVRCFVRCAYRYERTHRVTERAVVSGIDAADALGKKAADMASVVLWTTGDRRLGELLLGGVGWWIEGICGGVREGVGVGMAMVGEGMGRG